MGEMSELQERAAAARSVNDGLARARQPWLDALYVDCPVHHVSKGRYCFYPPPAVCGERVSAAITWRARKATP